MISAGKNAGGVAMRRNDDLDAWNQSDAVLKMMLRHKGREYPGQAICKGSAAECGTVFPEGCPVKIRIAKTALDTSNGKSYVLCEQQITSHKTKS